MNNLLVKIGFLAAVIMPLWNIPLMVRIIRRKTSEDISLVWLFGVWACILLMLPSALVSPDVILKAFGLVNAFFFTAVVVVVVLYRRK